MGRRQSQNYAAAGQWVLSSISLMEWPSCVRASTNRAFAVIIPAQTNLRALAYPAYGQNSLDSMASRVGAGVLEAVRRAEFLIFL